MKQATLLSIILFLITGQSMASEPERMSRSAGNQLNDIGIPLIEKLRLSPVIQSTSAPVSRAFKQEAVTASIPYRKNDHGLPVVFEFYDARIQTTADLDGDGYFHRLNISFDADVNSAHETVYAKLYLSLEGGDWQPYATSDLFEIRYDSAQDRFEVVTELLEGYEPGYYDVLIELHSLYHTGVVANRIITTDSDGYVLALEDLEHDNYYTNEDEAYYTSYGATGSMSMAGIFILGVLVLIKVRAE